MSKKNLLNESQIRKFMKYANITPLADKFISETYNGLMDEEEHMEEGRHKDMEEGREMREEEMDEGRGEMREEEMMEMAESEEETVEAGSYEMMETEEKALVPTVDEAGVEIGEPADRIVIDGGKPVAKAFENNEFKTLSLDNATIEKAYEQYRQEQLEKLAYENLEKSFEARFNYVVAIITINIFYV